MDRTDLKCMLITAFTGAVCSSVIAGAAIARDAAIFGSTPATLAAGIIIGGVLGASVIVPGGADPCDR